MMKIDVMTSTRAEYGLMRPLMKRMLSDSDIQMRLLVTGTHLSEAYGMTCREIERDNIPIYKKIPILSDASSEFFVAETMGNAIVRFQRHFFEDKPDFLFVDGDRYETLAVCLGAIAARVPIIHAGGGAVTEGVLDDCFRHSITKMSYLHFPTTELYRRRIIQMGEDPERVFAVGSMGIENIVTMQLLSREELGHELDFPLHGTYAVVTFHPVTLEDNTAVAQFEELLCACDARPDISYIFTMANADTDGDKINARLVEYAKGRENVFWVSSLGTLRYLSALKHCAFVLGNSSSGLIEAPSFHVPTINIGDRQRGRLQADSIINCEPSKKAILESIERAMSRDFMEVCQKVTNPYGDGKASEKIIFHIKNYYANHRIDLKKKFYDVSFDYVREPMK